MLPSHPIPSHPIISHPMLLLRSPGQPLSTTILIPNLQLDPHPPPRTRVAGPLSGPPFGLAFFGCCPPPPPPKTNKRENDVKPKNNKANEQGRPRVRSPCREHSVSCQSSAPHPVALGVVWVCRGHDGCMESPTLKIIIAPPPSLALSRRNSVRPWLVPVSSELAVTEGSATKLMVRTPEIKNIMLL